MKISRRVVWWKLTDVSEVLTISNIRAIHEAISISETSVNLYQATWHNYSEDGHPIFICTLNVQALLAHTNTDLDKLSCMLTVVLFLPNEVVSICIFHPI
jgi:hypothetical protein